MSVELLQSIANLFSAIKAGRETEFNPIYYVLFKDGSFFKVYDNLPTNFRVTQIDKVYKILMENEKVEISEISLDALLVEADMEEMILSTYEREDSPTPKLKLLDNGKFFWYKDENLHIASDIRMIPSTVAENLLYFAFEQDGTVFMKKLGEANNDKTN